VRICEKVKFTFHIFVIILECGERVPKGQLFVVQGKEAEVGQFPWHAGVYFLKDPKQTDPPKFWCGGSLLNRYLVLSGKQQILMRIQFCQLE